MISRPGWTVWLDKSQSPRARYPPRLRAGARAFENGHPVRAHAAKPPTSSAAWAHDSARTCPARAAGARRVRGRRNCDQVSTDAAAPGPARRTAAVVARGARATQLPDVVGGERFKVC